MSRIAVKEIKDGDLIRLQTFAIVDMAVREKKNNGGQFLSFKAADKTGEIEAVFWDWSNIDATSQSRFKSGQLIDLSGSVKVYNKKLQLVVAGFGAPTTTDMSEFEKVSEFDPDDMHRTFVGYVNSLENKWFRGVVSDIHSKYSPLFHTKPAATGMHHAFKHGLLEHTVQMLQTAEALLNLPFYGDNLNKDLCMFGIMMHDYFKILEYGDGPSFKKTAEGYESNHITTCIAKLGGACERLGVPEPLARKMVSIVASHHGRVAWGSPQTPSSPEAVFVHHVDNLHGTVFGVLQKLADDTSSEDYVKWGYSDDAMTLPKKRVTDLLKELENGTSEKDDDRYLVLSSRPEAEVDGF